MKLINDKKFLKALTQFMQVNKQSMFFVGAIEDLLSKHLHDLPKKMEINTPVNVVKKSLMTGYNQCLKDCEDK